MTTTATAALLAVPGALPASASASASISANAHAPAATCAPTTPTDRTFPLTTRIHGGPDAYEAGGEPLTWRLDLTNTTAHPCTGIHPVLVLVDERRALTTAQPRLEFYDGRHPGPHPVRFEATDAAETIGVFEADGFPGFTVGPGRTLSVRVRLAIGAGAVANEVVANAAVVQRRAGDGDWVGQSDDYRFRVVAPDPAVTNGTEPGVQPGVSPYDGELAGTGRRSAGIGLAGIALALLLTGGGVLLLARVRGVGRP